MADDKFDLWIEKHFSRTTRLTWKILLWVFATFSVYANTIQPHVHHDPIYAASWAAVWVFCFVKWAEGDGAWKKPPITHLTVSDTSQFYRGAVVVVEDRKYVVVKVTSPTTLEIRKR